MSRHSTLCWTSLAYRHDNKKLRISQLILSGAFNLDPPFHPHFFTEIFTDYAPSFAPRMQHHVSSSPMPLITICWLPPTSFLRGEPYSIIYSLFTLSSHPINAPAVHTHNTTLTLILSCARSLRQYIFPTPQASLAILPF